MSLALLHRRDKIFISYYIVEEMSLALLHRRDKIPYLISLLLFLRSLLSGFLGPFLDEAALGFSLFPFFFTASLFSISMSMSTSTSPRSSSPPALAFFGFTVSPKSFRV